MKYEDIEILKLSLDAGFPYNLQKLIREVLKTKNHEILEYFFHEKKLAEINKDMIICAANRNNIQALQWFVQYYDLRCLDNSKLKKDVRRFLRNTYESRWATESSSSSSNVGKYPNSFDSLTITSTSSNSSLSFHCVSYVNDGSKTIYN